MPLVQAAATAPAELPRLFSSTPCRHPSLPLQSRRRAWRPGFNPKTIWWAAQWAPAPSSTEHCRQGRRRCVTNLTMPCWPRSWWAPCCPLSALRASLRFAWGRRGLVRACRHVRAQQPPHPFRLASACALPQAGEVDALIMPISYLLHSLLYDCRVVRSPAAAPWACLYQRHGRPRMAHACLAEHTCLWCICRNPQPLHCRSTGDRGAAIQLV